MSSFSCDLDLIHNLRTANDTTHHFTHALEHARACALRIQELTKETPESLTWDATFGMFDEITRSLQEAGGITQLYTVVHPSEDMRDAARACEPLISAFVTELFLNTDIAHVLRQAATLLTSLSSSQQRFVTTTLQEYTRNGLTLPKEKQQDLTRINKRISEISVVCDSTLAETTHSLEVLPSNLDGLPQDFIKEHPANERGYSTLTTKTTDLFPILRYAHKRTIAEQLYILSENRGADITLPLLKELFSLRKEKATLLGYASWADYILEPRMAKRAKNVEDFLTNLHQPLIKKREEEMELYKKAHEELFSTHNSPILASDARYLEEKIKNTSFALDTKILSEYFPLPRVQEGIFAIASQLFSLSFEKMNEPTWHEDVQAFSVQKNGKEIARIFLDLFPRPNKYQHAAVFGIRESCKDSQGERTIPQAALVCNFPKPGASPALMMHESVTTFFHEFGHILHHILSTASLASQSGTNVARDFVETPSQLFEAWAWEKASLNLFARHYITNEPLPEDLLASMQRARTFGNAIATERQLFLATFDQHCHGENVPEDLEQLARELYPQFSSFTRGENIRFPATFGHLIGYDAAYYGYQWALAHAFDAQTRFVSDGMLNRETAHDLETCILAKGDEEDPEILLERFLKRPSSLNAYLSFLGISS